MPKLETAGKLRQIPVDQIIENGNVRTDYADIEELAASIESVGQLEPVLVKPPVKNNDTGLDEFELVAGFRRRRAFLYLKSKGQGFTLMDAVIVSGDKLTLQLVENLQRSDLSPMDREAGIYQLSKAGVSNKEIAARLSKSEPFVSRNLGAYKVRTILVQAATADIKADESGSDDDAIIRRDAAKQWLADINGLSTQALCEIQSVKKDALIPISKRLIAGGGTVACARRLVQELSFQKKPPAATAVETETLDISMDGSGDNVEPLMDDAVLAESGDAGEAAPPEPAVKPQSGKKAPAQPPARTLEEPPHKKVNLNSVQVVIRNYIETISKKEAGYEFEYKTDAAYEIWSLLLAELAGL